MQPTFEMRASRILVEQLATFRKAVAAVEDRRDFAAALQWIDDALALDPRSQLGRCLARIRTNVVRMQRDAARSADQMPITRI